jgi:MFS family permease
MDGTSRRDARSFLSLTTLSFAGDWLTTVALGVVLYQQTGNVAAPALYFAVRATPRLVGPFVGGLLADRSGPLLAAARLAALQGAATAIVLVAVMMHTPWLLLCAVAAGQVAGSALRPAYASALPVLAGGSERVGGLTAQLSASFAVTVLVAPAAGVLLLPVLQATGLVAIDIATFVVTATGFLLLHRRMRVRPERTASVTLANALAGFALVAKEPLFRVLVAVWCAAALAVTCTQSVLVAAVVDRTGNADATGLVYAAVGLGALAGCAASRLRLGSVGVKLILASFVVEVGALVAAAVVPSMPGLVVLIGVSSLGAIGYQVWGALEMMRRVPAELLGRINASVFFAMAVGTVSGGVLGAALIGPLGWQRTMLAGCSIGLLFVAGVTGISRLAPRHARFPAPAAVA